MKESLAIITWIVILTISISWRTTENSLMAHEICQKTFAKTKSIKTLQYEMRKEERIEGNMQVQVSFIKLNRAPYQVYMKQISPKKGLEVLYNEEENDGKALVSTNGFPWMTLKMDPEGLTMRKNQHHTTKDAGFDLVISILEHLFEKYESDLNHMLTMSGEIIYDNQKCHQIVFSNDQFKYFKYEVKGDENILQIARKYKL
ncbi:MAG: DUF1571 domain-containing protein [Saprospiraceae bacterium]|nr:DUF1571 domain-containing protein [Saprospiraceae bacterium]